MGMYNSDSAGEQKEKVPERLGEPRVQARPQSRLTLVKNIGAELRIAKNFAGKHKYVDG